MVSKYRLFCNFSMASVMVSSPLKPIFRASKVTQTSMRRVFILSHSCKKTFWYGPTSSKVAMTSSLLYLTSLNRSRMSCSTASAVFWLLFPPSELALESCGEISDIVLKSASHCFVLNPISAFVCRPKASGESFISVSTCSRTLLKLKLVDGALKFTLGSSPYGNMGISSKSSSFITNSSIFCAINLSKSLTMCPPYMISPKMYLKSAHGILVGAFSM
mmetsp:Transcript_18954/g.38953  ORF Transcript_18954/g.38953 Transcript_18954/m.38953 type:complete len:218 (-) Transcript_18954:1835-2488(-)